jgi:hypothetical protein
MGTLVAVVLLWVTPFIVALHIGERKGREGVAFALGFCLGWLGVLIIALTTPTDAARRTHALRNGFACPFCQEPVRTGATVCPHCQRDLPGDVR